MLAVLASGVMLLGAAQLLLFFTGATVQLEPLSKNLFHSFQVLLRNCRLLIQRHSEKCQVILNLPEYGKERRKSHNRNKSHEGKPSQAFNSSSSYGFIM